MDKVLSSLCRLSPVQIFKTAELLNNFTTDYWASNRAILVCGKCWGIFLARNAFTENLTKKGMVVFQALPPHQS